MPLPCSGIAGKSNRKENEIMSRILDWNKYIEKAAKTAAEGIVMLKNDNDALPLADG